MRGKLSKVDHVRQNLDAIGALGFVRRTCFEYGVRLESVLEGRQSKTVSQARRRAWVILRHTLDLSFREIADVFFLADHSTVCRAVREREQELQELYA